MTATRDGVRVELEWIGEGIEGEYKGRGDRRLLRFTVYRRAAGSWDAVEDASYCTQVSSRCAEKTKRKVAEHILAEVHDQVVNGCSIKKLCERLSWINRTWVLGRTRKTGWVLG